MKEITFAAGVCNCGTRHLVLCETEFGKWLFVAAVVGALVATLASWAA